MPACYCCGAVLDDDHLAWNYVWPDPIAVLGKRKRRKVLGFHSDAFLVADGFGAAIRVILPIHLDSGHTATVGVWLGLDGEDADRVNSAARDGLGCTFDGRLLNRVPPWPETYLSRITAVSPGEWVAARVTDSADETLKQVLAGTWPHAEFLRARPR